MPVLAINAYLGEINKPSRRAAEPAPADFDRTVQAIGGRVLAGVDDSPISYLAVDHAAAEAALHGRPLHLVAVRRAGDDPAGAALLRRLVDRVHAHHPEVVVGGQVVAGGNPAQALLTAATPDDLLVVGHRRGPAGTALGLSVADRVARRHPGPVLVVRMPGWTSDLGGRPIVVAVDGSPRSRAAVEFALTEARARGCDVTLLHVIGDRMDVGWAQTRDGVTVHHRIISGDPVDRLVTESGQAAAVVLGRHPRGPQSGGLLAATLQVLPQRGHCPVFLVG